MPAPRVTFYVLGDVDEAARRVYACRLIEKAYLHRHRVLLRCNSAAEASDMDELLWRFSDRSFVPHELVGDDGSSESPVGVLASGQPAMSDGMLVNLGTDVPAWYEGFERIAEVVGGGDDSRRAARDRFRFYREHGMEPETHNIGGG